MKCHNSPLISLILFFLLVFYVLYVHNPYWEKLIWIEKLWSSGCLIAKDSCQFFNVFPNGYFEFKTDYFSLFFPSLKLVGYLWLFTLCSHLPSTYLFWSSQVFLWLSGGCVMCIKRKELVNFFPNNTLVPLSSFNIVLL